jgi:putative ABC transport system ATP-binding protein
MTPKNDIIIETQNLSRHYYLGGSVVKALDQVSFSIFKGVFLGITGASGSGKSTLLYLLGGLDYPTTGQINIGGQNITQLNENQMAIFRRHTVGFVYQSFHLIPSMSAVENVELPMILAGVSKKIRRERAFKLLEVVGLGNRTKHKPAELSGGQQQRVAIARALVNHPPILLADEPTGNLDTRTGVEIIQLFHKLCREQKLTIVMVSHDWSAIQDTECYFRMQDGQIIEIQHLNPNRRATTSALVEVEN